ncbi:MAG: regulatory iron-sulfur-containing complex subunit RicT [Candidatus Sumerlaeota bacterium]|nr:regulatory iron-sulfur-containing complex subunit RicT [Candidatus Sumerlaeota bacterium]
MGPPSGAGGKAIELCKEKARELNLDMKISTVRFDDRGRRVIFHFTADQRVDFRQLVRELAAALHARIELWQIGVRDEARVIHGFGICGKELCCASWIREFQPVSIRQAKDQDLLLSPAKLSGMCGRLRCCLTYEHGQYKECAKSAPGIGAICRCRQMRDPVVVVDRNLLRATATVKDEQGGLHSVPFADIAEVLGKAPPSALKQDAGARLSTTPETARAEEAQPAAEAPEVDAKRGRRRGRRRKDRDHKTQATAPTPAAAAPQPPRQESAAPQPERGSGDSEARRKKRHGRRWRRSHRPKESGDGGQ